MQKQPKVITQVREEYKNHNKNHHMNDKSHKEKNCAVCTNTEVWSASHITEKMHNQFMKQKSQKEKKRDPSQEKKI